MSDKDCAEIDLRKLFGANVRHFRKLRGFTQDQLAHELGVTIDMAGRLERGQVGASFRTISRLASIFGISEFQFFQHQPSGLPSNPRTRTLEKVHVALAKMSDEELEQAKRILEALHP
ncbi:helix-turn-helix domain-containing protein [Kordiimonas sp.]|uniref:helix-turn-helix domain-containing protein n=1 Tax=Kordiimonas sp. TaxID=1970157 RepID=UPI003A9019AA